MRLNYGVCTHHSSKDTAKIVLAELHKRRVFRHERKAYLFINPDRMVYLFGEDHQNTTYMLKNYPKWFVGVYDHNIEPGRLLEDIEIHVKEVIKNG